MGYTAYLTPHAESGLSTHSVCRLTIDLVKRSEFSLWLSLIVAQGFPWGLISRVDQCKMAENRKSNGLKECNAIRTAIAVCFPIEVGKTRDNHWYPA
jgi:hypothetical protein